MRENTYSLDVYHSLKSSLYHIHVALTVDRTVKSADMVVANGDISECVFFLKLKVLLQGFVLT